MKAKKKVSKKEKWNLQGGVLIIGSLLWQDSLDIEKNDLVRKRWRTSSLDSKRKIMIKCPIRYGRASKSGIFTMTFSKQCETGMAGTAYFVPFKKKTQDEEAILKQAKDLSVAEGMKGKHIVKDGESRVWAALALLVNPKSNDKIKLLTNIWEKTSRESGGIDPSIFRLGNEESCISEEGFLTIDWPRSIDPRNSLKIDQIDFMLATATVPTEYPGTKQLQSSIEKDTTRFYFVENLSSGITTFQDNEVLNILFAKV